jgi:hypothetical protein
MKLTRGKIIHPSGGATLPIYLHKTVTVGYTKILEYAEFGCPKFGCTAYLS